MVKKNKTFTEKYTLKEFQLINEIRKVYLLKKMAFSGNYQPYQIRTLDSFSQIGFKAKLKNKEVFLDLYVRNLKLDYAIQVWNKAHELTKHKFPDYEHYNWLKTNNNPVKKLQFISENRNNAEKYFYHKLEDICTTANFSSSEIEVFKQDKNKNYAYRLDVIINTDKIIKKTVNNLIKQYSKNEKFYNYEIKNQRFSFDDIKNYYVYCDERFLSLLNAEDGLKEITNSEYLLFQAAENFNLDGIISAVNQGANINAADTDGETAFTKIFQRFNDEINFNTPINIEKLTEHTIFFAKKILEMGADIDFFGYGGVNALQYTAYSHNPILMKFLLDNGANPNINYFPEDGMDFIKSIPLDTILSDYYISDDEKNLNICKKLLLEAGAII